VRLLAMAEIYGTGPRWVVGQSLAVVLDGEAGLVGCGLAVPVAQVQGVVVDGALPGHLLIPRAGLGPLYGTAAPLTGTDVAGTDRSARRMGRLTAATGGAAGGGTPIGGGR
jgi:hypothetical protein